MNGPLVLSTEIQGLGVGCEVVDGAVGEGEGLVCPEESSVVEQLAGVVLDQGARLVQERHGLQEMTCVCEWKESICCTRS